MNSSLSRLVRGTIAAIAAAAGLLLAGGSLAQESVRPEVGKPLQAAQDLIKSGRYR